MKILVRIPNWLGDVVMAVPSLRRLRDMFPEAAIDLLGPAWASDILSNTSVYDGFLPVDGQRSRSVVSLAHRLRQSRYDLGLLLTNSFSSAFSMRLAGIPRRFGYSTDGRGFLLTDRTRVSDTNEEQHHVYNYLKLVDELASKMGRHISDTTAPEISIAVSPDTVSDARSFLNNLGVDESRAVIALGAGSANSNAKRWGAERFAALNDLLQDELDACVILLGSGDDHEVAAEVAAQSRRRPIDLTGQTDLSRAAGILQRARAVVSNDMGLAHLSGALCTPTFVIFGPTDARRTRPFSGAAKVLTANVECSPCMLRECPIDHRCMTRVTVEDVFSEVKAALAARQ